MPIHVDPAGASLHGKIAVVTGGAGSIGSAVVSRLVSEGVRVIAVDQDRAPDPAAAGVNYLRGDVTHPATAQRAVATAEAAFGGLDLLVNAASSSRAGGLADMDLTCWNRVLAVNLTGTLLACQAAVPAMRRRGGGAIVDLARCTPWTARASSLPMSCPGRPWSRSAATSRSPWSRSASVSSAWTPEPRWMAMAVLKG